MMKKSFQNGRYLVLSRLGIGGLATVWRVLDSKFDIERAIKVLQIEHLSEGDIHKEQVGFQRFAREALVMMQLQHPNIVTVFDSFEEDEFFCIVMEKCFGSLEGWLLENGSMSPKLTAQVMIAVLSALQHAHSKGVVHRDIKPHNILISENGEIKLTDFGLAMTSFASQSLTKTNAILGSIQFMSPEQRKNSKHVTNPTDIYSCAMTMAYLLEGQGVDDLFVSETISHLQSKYPPDLVEILAVSGQREPQNRYTALEMRQKLLTILPNLPSDSNNLMNVQLVETYIEDISLPSDTLTKDETLINTSVMIVPKSLYGLMAGMLLLLLAIAVKLLWTPDLNQSDTEVGVVATESTISENQPIPKCANVGTGFQEKLILGPRESKYAQFFDLDQDDFQDAIFFNRMDNTMSVYWGNPNFAFEVPDEFPITKVDSMPLFSDMNHDGIIDIVGLHHSSNKIAIYKGEGNRQFRKYREMGPENMFQDPPPIDGALHDLNGDGWDDLIFTVNAPKYVDKEMLLYRENSQRGLDALMKGIPNVEEETLNWHKIIFQSDDKLHFGKISPHVYWVNDDGLYRQKVLNSGKMASKELLVENIGSFKILGVTGYDSTGDQVLLRQENLIYLWSESGLCQLMQHPYAADVKDIAFWDDDEYLDVLVSLTCRYCTSNHIILLGQP